ncbi:16840_t:CDS:2, partial [Acaulospora colombiana]
MNEIGSPMSTERPSSKSARGTWTHQLEAGCSRVSWTHPLISLKPSTILEHTMPSSVVTVSQPTKKSEVGAPRPAHHRNDTQSLFTNPWPSYQYVSASYFMTQQLTHDDREFPVSAISRMMAGMLFSPPKIPQDVEKILKLQTPNWGEGSKKEDLKATWLGHACWLVELPAPEGATRGPRILYDPVMSHRCSPFSFMGPARYTSKLNVGLMKEFVHQPDYLGPPCTMEEIPEIDIVVISHNHYDHMDTPTLSTLLRNHNPHFFAPLNNDATFQSVGIDPSRFHCLDWWDDREVTVELPLASVQPSETTPKAMFRVTCTPCQHQSARTAFDRNHTLWSSWAVEELPSPGQTSSRPGFKIWFGGDTGYRYVGHGQDEDKVPFCPAFKEIGEKFGSFDLALIPIGAYNVRAAMSGFHASPSDAVRIFQDINAKKGIGMHWGTWTLTLEPILEPPELLASEAKKAGLADDAFTVCGLGETCACIANCHVWYWSIKNLSARSSNASTGMYTRLKRSKQPEKQEAVLKSTMAASVVTVSRSPKKDEVAVPRPAHHANDTKNMSPLKLTSFIFSLQTLPPKPEANMEELLKLQKPNWGADAKSNELKATWLGHACFLVELPKPEARYTRPPCPMEDIPEIDIVVISHNHYDHMDTPTLTTLLEKHNPHFFAPLNNEATFASVGIPESRFHCLDWWDDREVNIELPLDTTSGSQASTPKASLRITCTPCQHQSARGMFDRMKTLWSSWAIEEVSPSGSASKPGFKVWFGGDTGYRYVGVGQDENEVPYCPAFKEIGEKFGSFDLALIPIGAYQPRAAMSGFHASPSDAVRIFQDIKAKKAIGMHWG